MAAIGDRETAGELMRICYLNNYLSLRGGSERVLFNEADLMSRAGHVVSFFGRRGPQDITQTHAAFYPPVIDLEQLSLVGKIRHAPKLIYNAGTAHAFRRFLQEVRPSLLHAHNIYGGVTTAVLDVAREAQLPVVLTAHDYKLVCPSYLALDHGQVCAACAGQRFYHCLLKRCHKSNLVASGIYTCEAYLTTWLHKYASVRLILCPSHFMCHTLLANGFAADRVRYLPNAIDATAISPAIGGGAYALYVGRLSAEKGILTLLRALENTTVPARIIGDGPLRDVLAEQIVRRHLQDRVTLVGYQTGKALAQTYRDAAFCVVPSEWYENAPMAVLEAFAYGKPVIGAAIGGIPELITPETTGLLFPPGDSPALRTCLETLWQARGALGDLGQAARLRVETTFAADRHAESLLQVYAEIVAGG